LSSEAEQAKKDAIYRAIGRFIAEFSVIESILKGHLAIEVKLRTDFYDAIITHDFSLLCTAVLQVFSSTIQDEALVEDLKKFISRCRKINDVRVKVAHGDWWPHEAGGAVRHVSRQKLESVRSTDMTEALEKHADEAYQLGCDIDALFVKHYKQEQDRRKKQRVFRAMSSNFP
jgi:hypothetical protein